MYVHVPYLGVIVRLCLGVLYCGRVDVLNKIKRNEREPGKEERKEECECKCTHRPYARPKESIYSEAEAEVEEHIES
jgi:hypothetical protein